MAAGILVFILLIPSFRRRLEKIADIIAESMIASGNYRRWALMALATLPILWFCRMPTNLLGDGYTIIHNIGDELPVVFKWSEIGAVGTIFYISRLVPLEGLERAVVAFGIVSVISGAITIFFFLAIAGELGRSAQQRLFTFLLLIFSGWMLLFFGYAENYPMLWPFITAYLFFSIRYCRGQGSLFVPLIILLVAIFLHLQVMFFATSFFVVALSRGRGRHFFNRYKKLVWIAGGIVGLAGLFLFIEKYNNAIEFRVHFLPLFEGRPRTPYYAVFSPAHLGDILNEFSLLIPLWPLLLFAGWRGWWSRKFTAVDWYLVAFSAGGLILLLMLDPRIGMGRDWDLFALTALGPALLLIRCLWNEGAKAPIPFGMVFLGLVCLFPFFVTNLGYRTSADYLKYLLDLDRPLSKPGIVMLRDYYADMGDKVQADSLNKVAIINYPAESKGRWAYKISGQGRFDEALSTADSLLRADPYASESYNLMGSVYFQRGMITQAIKHFEVAVKLKPYDYYSLTNLGLSYLRDKKYQPMMEVLRRAQNVAPEYDQMLQAIAQGFYRMRRYDSAYVYGQDLIRLDSASAIAFLTAGSAAYKLQYNEIAHRYLSRYLELDPRSSERERVHTMIKELQDAINNKK